MKALLVATLLLVVCLPIELSGQQEFIPPEQVRVRYKNRRGPKGEGSCVFVSWGLAGAHHGVPAAEFMPEQSPFGSPELDGGWPERVQRVAEKRQISIWNIEGAQTIAWIQWALANRRMVTITYGHAHMINAVGMSEDGQRFFLWDNNYPTEIRAVDRATFIREHRIFGGGWCFVHREAFGSETAPPPWIEPRRRRRR